MSTEKETFFERLTKERADLSKKMGKLTDFIATAKFLELGDDQKELLYMQRTIMLQYLEVLDRRITILSI